MNEQTFSIPRSEHMQAVGAWLSDHETDLQSLAANLSAGPVTPHFSIGELVTIMERKVWIHAVIDPRFFAAGDVSMLREAWRECLTALIDGQRYALRIHIIL